MLNIAGNAMRRKAPQARAVALRTKAKREV